MSKLTGAALDRAVANAMGLKSVHNCEKWVGLTEDEIDKIFLDVAGPNKGTKQRFARAIEAKLREKNT